MKYMDLKNIELFLNFLKDKNIIIKPINEKDFSGLKKLVSHYSLPKVYLEFMEKAGGRLEIWDGSSYRMDELPILKDAANEILDENGIETSLKDYQFVFFMHQGYQFYFFDLTEGNDPPVYYYGEGEDMETYIKKSDSFSTFLIEYYNGMEHLFENR